MTAVDAVVLSPVLSGESTMVLFDWNGTVVIDDERARASLNAALVRRGLASVDRESFATVFRLPMAEMFTDLGVQAGELNAAEAEWNEAMASEDAVLRDGALDTLQVLHGAGVWLGVVSAAAAPAVDHDRLSLAVPEVWRLVESSVSDKVRVLAANRGERERAVYVGDTAYDMRSAVAAGYLAVGVTGGYGSAEALLAAGAQHLIADLADLVPLVLGPVSHPASP
ncbi:HAD family hydrolase [Plantibacter sp. YIM 135249]|uniref:HAD family hydrolase n=1 Tax=Plantibacter sp. YIM 135249 TaxID=3423918 RepID=UPI003D352E52